MPSWFWVPVSNLYGSSLEAGRTLYAFSSLSNSYRPYNAPACGPKNLYEEHARKSQPISCTSMGPCGAYCTASIYTSAPASFAIFVNFLTGFTVPNKLDAYPNAAILGFFSSALAKSSTSSVPSSKSISTQIKLQPLSSATNIHGAMFAS